MTNDSHGEVFGQALSLAAIGISVMIMLAVLWQPAPAHVATVSKPGAQSVQIVAKTPAPHHYAG